VHAALVPGHLRESLALGVAFALSAGVLAGASLTVRDPRFDSWAPGTAGSVLAATSIAYVASRTSGIPWLVPHPEPLDVLGMCTTATELVAVLAATTLLPRKVRP
jgi:hypothetical protein